MSKISKKKASQKTRSRLPWKKQKRPLLPQHPTQEDIASYKSAMSKIVELTNMRMEQVLSNHMMTTEMNRFFNGDISKRFDISQLTDPGELRAYMTEVNVVLNSIGENSRKAEIDTAIMDAERFRGQFGNQYQTLHADYAGKQSVTHFNLNDVIDEEGRIVKERINPDIASEAFAAYRKLEEAGYAGYIGRQGQEMMFGSENLIILLYDFYDRGEDGFMHAKDILEAWIDNQLLEIGGINLSLSEANRMVSDWDDFFERRYF